MGKQVVVNISNSGNDVDRATVGFVMANNALEAGMDVVAFLSVEGARLAVQGYSDDLHQQGFPPLKELIAKFAEKGGQIWVCSPCFTLRGYQEEQLVPGASLVRGVKVLELLANGVGCINF